MIANPAMMRSALPQADCILESRHRLIGVVTVGAMLTLTAPAAYANPEKDCLKHGGQYSSSAPGNGLVYSSCDLEGGKSIGWMDGKNPVVYPTPNPK